MIVAIVDKTTPTGVVHVHEFRVAEDEAAALASFNPANPEDWAAVDSGWSVYQPPGPHKRWAYDFDDLKLLPWWPDLGIAKIERTREIDARTAELVVGGYSHNARTFSSSEVAQKNLEVLDRNKDALSYPFYMATRDNDEIYPISDATELHTMYLTGLGTVLGFYQSGNVLKQQVLDATTIAEVVAVEDNR